MPKETADTPKPLPLVMIVDDEPGIRSLLCRLLSHHGYETIAAADAEEALSMIKTQTPELIITDMIMPGMNGNQLMESVREDAPLLPFIVITGNPRVESAVEVIKGGAADYITKPFDLNEILLKIKHVLAEAKKKRSNAYVGTVFGMRLDRIGDYKIEDILGEGASGIVFRASRDNEPPPGKWVIKALKLPGESNAQAREAALQRFQNEAHIGTTIKHDRIVPIVDYGMTGDGAIPYLAMAYVEGRPLSESPDFTEAPPKQGCEILAQIAEALHAVHAAGVVHRDVKPGNVMIDSCGNAILMDFSVAHVPQSSLTRADMIIGSPAYMAPESFQGKGVDFRADLFSLGVMGYEILTGERPFAGDTLARFAQIIPSELPAAPSDINPIITPAMETVLARLLKKTPADRFDSAGEAAAAFRDAIKAPPIDREWIPSAEDWTVDEDLF